MLLFYNPDIFRFFHILYDLLYPIGIILYFIKKNKINLVLFNKI